MWLNLVQLTIVSLLICRQVYFATLAEQAERYDDMAEHMKSVEAPVITTGTFVEESQRIMGKI